MKILYLHTPGHMVAGSEIVLMDMINLLPNNIDYEVIVPDEGIFFKRLKKEGFNVSALSLFNFNRYAPWPYIKSLWTLVKAVIKINPDIIHSSSAAPVQYAYPISKLLNIPLVCHIQCPYGKDDLRRYFPHLANRIIVVSKTVKNIFQKQYFHKISMIYHGINFPYFNRSKARCKLLGKYNIPNRRRIIGMVGQLTHRKGVDLLLKALPRILKSNPNTHLLLFGDETEYSCKLKHLSVKLNTQNNITWCGFSNNSQQLMAGMDILVVPSRSEGFGLVAAEAMAVGTPAVVSLTEGLTEIITDHHTGLFFQPGNVKKLSEKIVWLLNNPHAAWQYGNNGKKRVKSNFSSAYQKNKLLNIYNDMLNPASNQKSLFQYPSKNSLTLIEKTLS